MIANRTLLDELETVLAGSDIGRRAGMLRRVADLFASPSGDPCDERTALFDDVMRRLVDEIETSAGVHFAGYLARRPAAPDRILRRLALDDVIDVARPILPCREHFDRMTLAEGARNSSPAHLPGISTRKVIPETATDMLAERANREVSSPLCRPSRDDDLAVCTCSRIEIPRLHLLKLFADASAALKRRLSKEDPLKAVLMAEMVARAIGHLQTQTREMSVEFVTARAFVRSLSEAGKLNEVGLFDLASSGKFAETALALSEICALPIGLVERALGEERSEQVLVLARAVDLTWETTKSILLLPARAERATGDPDALLETFLRLRPQTARTAVQFYRLRERSLARSSN